MNTLDKGISAWEVSQKSPSPVNALALQEVVAQQWADLPVAKMTNGTPLTLNDSKKRSQQRRYDRQG